MKKILSALLFGLTINIYAQNTDCHEFVQTEIIDKIKNYTPTDLVPYSNDGNSWGLMDVKSKKTITKPIIHWAAVFKPLLKVGVNDCEIEIYKDYTYHAKLSLESKAWSPEVTSIATMNEIGFEVNEIGEMTAYSKSYKRHNWDSWNISKPIKQKNEYFAIIQQEKQKILINQKGEKQKGFVFKEAIVLPYPHKDEPLLYVKDFEDNRGFITLSGKKILYGKLMSYPLTSNNYFGYSIQRDEDVNIADIKKSGVLDLVTQKWLIKPQKKYKIYSMIYTSEEKINEEDPRNRDKANIYFLAIQNGEHFVLDINGNAIKPN